MAAQKGENKDLREFIANLPYAYEVTSHAKEIIDGYAKHEGKHVSVAGRAMAIRKAGKLIFIDLQDQSGKIQAYFDYQLLGEDSFNAVKALGRGDIIGVEGTVFKTTPGQISVRVEKFVQLGKAIRTLPDKWHGLQDTELRYRKRYLDMMMNDEVRELFITRTKAITLMRQFFDNHNFLEVETATVQPIYGGAAAQPFTTHVNTLNEDHYLRISTEMNLKRLLMGGFERVYEIGKVFRNEDLDTRHSPEYTHMEFYHSFIDYNGVMDFVEEMLAFIVKGIKGSTTIEYQGKKMDFKRPFRRVSFIGTLNEKTGEDVLSLSDEKLFKLAEAHGVKFLKGQRIRTHAYDKLFDVFAEGDMFQPTFIVDYPAEMTPFARPKRGDKRLIEMFELHANNQEIGPGYSELNNAIIQRENFEYQEKIRKQGDVEAPPADMDFVEAMEYGMPPAGGYGMGIDRLMMILTNKTSIKEVILFPMEKRGTPLGK